MSVKHNGRKPLTNRQIAAKAARAVAHDIRSLSDAEIYALTYSADRSVRRIADRIAHERAEAYAFAH